MNDDQKEEALRGAKRPRWRRVEAMGAVSLLAAAMVLLLILELSGRHERAARHALLHGKPVPVRKGELSLSVLAAGPSELVLTLQFRNVGKVPLKVDRDLVFLVHMDAVGPRSEKIKLENAGGGPRADRTEMEERIVSLEPGESISRQIDLLHGFREFYAVQLLVPRPEGHDRCVTQAGESLCRVPDGTWPARVFVRYGRTSMEDALGSYADDLYDEPLWADVWIPVR